METLYTNLGLERVDLPVTQFYYDFINLYQAIEQA
jgi:hypothetical protein